MQFANGFEMGKFHDLHFKGITSQPDENAEEWWVPLNDSAAGTLCECSAVRKTLHGSLDGKNFIYDMVDLIILRKPKKVILPYNGFGATACRDYIAFLKAVWKKRQQIDSSLALYVPQKSIFSCSRVSKLSDRNFRSIRMGKSSSAELPSYEDYIDYDRPRIPFFDLDAREIDFMAFYDFCCRKLAYITKTEMLFPRLDSGMTNYNTGAWKAYPDYLVDHFNLHSEYNCIHGQILRLWKLLDELSLKEGTAWLPLNPFCRDKASYCWWQHFPRNYSKIKKNLLAKSICRKDKYLNEYHFLFPLVLFLGHYAEYENAQCYIPEYNFHELIDALIRIIKGQEIPELLPDIPGEEEISLEAYRGGIVKLPPACMNYESKGNQIIAQFKNADTAYGFVEKIYPHISAELCFADTCGKIVFRNVSDRTFLLADLEKAKTICREYPIKLYLLDGTTIRKMSLQEILAYAAERIIRYFPHDYRDAIHYLNQLSVKFKNRYQRYSVVK